MMTSTFSKLKKTCAITFFHIGKLNKANWDNTFKILYFLLLLKGNLQNWKSREIIYYFCWDHFFINPLRYRALSKLQVISIQTGIRSVGRHFAKDYYQNTRIVCAKKIDPILDPVHTHANPGSKSNRYIGGEW